jgi:hypothetical protein
VEGGEKETAAEKGGGEKESSSSIGVREREIGTVYELVGGLGLLPLFSPFSLFFHFSSSSMLLFCWFSC